MGLTRLWSCVDPRSSVGLDLTLTHLSLQRSPHSVPELVNFYSYRVQPGVVPRLITPPGYINQKSKSLKLNKYFYNILMDVFIFDVNTNRPEYFVLSGNVIVSEEYERTHSTFQKSFLRNPLVFL